MPQTNKQEIKDLKLKEVSEPYNIEIKSNDERVWFSTSIESEDDLKAIEEIIKIYIKPKIKKAN